MLNSIALIKRIFSEKLLIEVESPDTDLLDSGILDSMALVELLLNLENQVGYQVDMENLDMESFRSITSIAELVQGARKRAEVA